MKSKQPNRLINETSPYLLQHAYNPVDWHAYNDAAFDKARAENKPLLISIGYSACHWCHVMEHESFSNPEIAQVMNHHFICIKVDREERPDVDLLYMNAVQLLHGSGGWPLNCFALPNGDPFWGGTYFRPDQWIDLLGQISGLYHKNIADVHQQADRLKAGIQSTNLIETAKDESYADIHSLHEAYEQLALRFDGQKGGMTGSPKFPMPAVWSFVLDYHAITKNKEALAQVTTTLDCMERGGIFDQIGGGFARYSTDGNWKVPHFEKMLYDNAQLASLYARAYWLTRDTNLLNTLSLTLDFISSQLTSADNIFYASLDADSEGKEGLYYLWEKSEIFKLLPDYGELISDYYGIDGAGKWEHNKNILLRPLNNTDFATRQHLSEKELVELVKMSRKVMLNHRKNRIPPALDDKVITSWNALMIKGWADAALATSNKEWKETALLAAESLYPRVMSEDNSLKRTYKNGKARIEALLNDYAFLADAFVSLYQLSFDIKWLNLARQLTEQVFQRFDDATSPLFWLSSGKSEQLQPLRLKETTDGAEPCGNSVMAKVLWELGHLLGETSWTSRAEEMVKTMKSRIIAYPSAHSMWASVAANMAFETTLVVITGDQALDLLPLSKKFKPNVIYAAAQKQEPLQIFNQRFKPGETLIFVCQGNVCKAAVDHPDEVLWK
ncbi:thioredoxin domain-containing protein [Lentimicrobium sp.]